MPRYDFQCANGHVRTNVWVSSFRDAAHVAVNISPCECGLPMEKQPCAPAFKVSGFNAANGYSKKD